VELDQYLESVDLFDCTGRVTHTLTLQIDGSVRIRTHGGGEVVVDPIRRTALTAGAVVADTLLDAAAQLGRT
jgi:hypothetical protein